MLKSCFPLIFLQILTVFFLNYGYAQSTSLDNSISSIKIIQTRVTSTQTVKVSKVAGGYLSRGILALFEKFRNGLISAGEFVARVQEFGFMKALFEDGGEAAIRKTESLVGKIATLGCNIVKTRVSVRSTPEEDCAAAALAQVNQALKKLVDFPATDAFGNTITPDRLISAMDNAVDVPGFDKVAKKLTTAGASGNIKGAVGELERASGLRKLGATDVEFKGEITFTDSTGALAKSDIDIAYRNAEGNLVFEEVKSAQISSLYFDTTNQNGIKNTDQARKFAEAARKNGAIPQWNVPDCSFISSLSLSVLNNIGIEVFDSKLGKC